MWLAVLCDVVCLPSKRVTVVHLDTRQRSSRLEDRTSTSAYLPHWDDGLWLDWVLVERSELGANLAFFLPGSIQIRSFCPIEGSDSIVNPSNACLCQLRHNLCSSCGTLVIVALWDSCA